VPGAGASGETVGMAAAAAGRVHAGAIASSRFEPPPSAHPRAHFQSPASALAATEAAFVAAAVDDAESRRRHRHADAAEVHQLRATLGVGPSNRALASLIGMRALQPPSVYHIDGPTLDTFAALY